MQLDEGPAIHTTRARTKKQIGHLVDLLRSQILDGLGCQLDQVAAHARERGGLIITAAATEVAGCLHAAAVEARQVRRVGPCGPWCTH